MVPSPSKSRGSPAPLAGVLRAAKMASMSLRSIWPRIAAASQSSTGASGSKRAARIT